MQSTMEVFEDLLSAMRKLVDENMQFVHPERRIFFEALQKLQEGDIKEATRLFRKAARRRESESDVAIEELALMGLAACEQAGGRDGAALKCWRKLAENQEASRAARYMAWLNVCALDEAREDKLGLKRAIQALNDLGEPVAF